MVSKACYVAAYRRKLELIAAEPDVDLTLLVPPYWQFGPRREPLEAGFDQGYRTIVDNPRFNGRHHWHWYPRIERHLAAVRPDIVHIDEEPYDLVTLHTQHAARRYGSRTLFFTWQNLPLTLPLPFRVAESSVLRRADAAIAGNAEAAAILRAKGFAGPLVTLPQFGVDETVFSPAERRTERPFTIGFAGRLVPEKGVGDLLAAAAGLDGGWRLRFVGSGPEASALQREAARLGASDRVEVVAAVGSGQMAETLRGFDVLALPSRTLPRWKEQFGRVLVEAMSCGVPVIGSDSGEIPQVIGDAGLVVAEADTVGLRTALRRVRDEPGLAQRLSTSARSRVLARFTQASVAAATVELYRRIGRSEAAGTVY